MREMLNPTSALAGMKLDKSVALITTADSLVRAVAHPSVMFAQKRRQAAKLVC